MVLRKDQIEAALAAESQEISAGRLKEDNPLDTSEPFRKLCEACRRGDLKVVHESVAEGVNINARDLFDYTPLILVIHPAIYLCIPDRQLTCFFLYQRQVSVDIMK
jgi:ankyrin repeat/BTB/POZ domain-containing protein 1